MSFFSVVIFTKNRSEIIGFALESVLKQTFSDFEVIIADNDDTDATAAVVGKYQNPRIRYHRTGDLSMVDNWEAGMALARGDYVLCLTDRSALRSYALQRIKAAIELYHEEVYVWSFDTLSADFDNVWRAQTKTPQIVPSADLFDLFLTEPYNVYSVALPRGLNSCHSRALLDRIKQAEGRVFLPISPDYTLAFLTLAHCSRVVLLNEPLFLWGYEQFSNGGGLYGNSETFMRCMRDMNLADQELFNEVPIKTTGIHNVVCNDLLKLRRHNAELPGLDLPSYFVVCRREFDERLSPDDPIYAEKIAAWNDALAKQSPEVIAAVNLALDASPERDQVVWYRTIWRVLYNSAIARGARSRLASRETLPRFENILQAMSWIEGQPSVIPRPAPRREAATPQSTN